MEPVTPEDKGFIKSKPAKGRLQLKILVVFTTKTGGEGSGQLLTSL